MATLLLKGYKSERVQGSVRVHLHVTGDHPIKDQAEVATAAEATAAFEAFKARAAATGMPLTVSGMLKPGHKAPRGFKQLKLEGIVNLEEAA